VSKTLVASVGRLGGVNHPGGPKTIDAIQKFQLFHFGWNGTDGRVGPDGQTLRKLHQFENGRIRCPLPVTLLTMMRCRGQ
jgi:hypothetical protein